MKSKVFFSRTISSETLEKLYLLLDKKPVGILAIKLHSGEKGNQNFLRPVFFLE